MRRHRLADIGEGFAPPDPAGFHVWAEGQDRDGLAGMVGALPGRIAAVIGGDDRQIAGLQFRLEFGQPPIELFQRRGVARHVAAVAEQHVEIDEIGEQEIAVLQPLERGQRGVEQGVVAGRLDDFAHPLMGEDIADLADADDAPTGGHHPVQQRRFGWRNRIVAPIGGAFETPGIVADKGPGDDPADVQRIDQAPRDLAGLVEPVEPEGGFVGGDLEHRIG